MFVLSKEMVKEVLEGKLNYNDIPCDQENEISKGYHFKDQARVNLALSKTCVAMCLALEKKCKMEACRLFARKSGNIPNGWVCREFQIDFPEATFDARFHVPFIGVDKLDREETKKRFEELKTNGANYVCLGCKRVYANKPTQWQEDGHGGGDLEMCSCGSDLFDSIGSFIEKL